MGTRRTMLDLMLFPVEGLAYQKQQRAQCWKQNQKEPAGEERFQRGGDKIPDNDEDSMLLRTS